MPIEPKEMGKIYDEKYGGISGNIVMIYLLDKLEDGTKKLNRLTITLIILTIVLAIIAGIDIYSRLYQN